MQSRLAYKLLFDEQGPTGKPLFSSVSELAEAVGTFREQEKGQNRSLSSFLSQILNLGQRSCPPALMDAIEEAVMSRLQGEPSEAQDEWRARVRRALTTDNLSRKSAEPLSAEVLFGELLYLAETAREHYIITAVTAEVALSKRAEPLREALLRRLHMLEADSTLTINTKYTFCLPTDDDCYDWWAALTRAVKNALRQQGKQFDPDALNAYLTHLEDKGYLSVYVVPPNLCGCPVVVFDPEEPNLSGYNLYYFSDRNNDEYLVSVAKMDPMYLPKWKSNVYSPLENDRIGRIRFKHNDKPKGQP